MALYVQQDVRAKLAPDKAKVAASDAKLAQQICKALGEIGGKKANYFAESLGIDLAPMTEESKSSLC